MIRLRSKAVVFSLILSSFANPFTWADPLPDDSVVYIECTSKDKTKHKRGSGVIIDERGTILTAKHVAPADYSCVAERGTAANVPTRRLVPRRISSQYDARLLAFVPKPGETFVSAKYVRLKDSMKKAAIFAYGFPENGTGELSPRSGIISTVVPNAKGEIGTDALSAQGMSGGPVFLAEDGGLVGLVAGANFDNLGQPTDFAVLAAETVANELGLKEAELRKNGRSNTECALSMKLDEYLKCMERG